jgi:glutamate synthase domain-containing protein 1
MNDIMEDYDHMVANADAETIREWVEQALYIMRSETVEAVVESIKQTKIHYHSDKMLIDDIIQSLRTELLGKKDV